MRYTNFNFQSDHDDSRSMSDYVFILNRRAICWKSSKQHTVTDSVCEAEYITISDTAKKVVWLQKFIIELGVTPSVDGLVLLYYDNIEVVAQTKEPKSH